MVSCTQSASEAPRISLALSHFWHSPEVASTDGNKGILSCFGAVSAFLCCATQQRNQRLLNEQLWEAAKNGDAAQIQVSGSSLEERVDGGDRKGAKSGGMVSNRWKCLKV
jgi:hypothetical protein